jgi:hypothetical protein
MLSRMLCLILIGLVAHVGHVTSAIAQDANTTPEATQEPSPSKPDEKAEKIRRVISRVGVGPDSRIEITLLDNTKLKGFVSERTNDYFVLTDTKTAVTNRIEYQHVDKVNVWPAAKAKMKLNFSTPARVFKNFVIAVTIVAGLALAVCGLGKRCQN